MTTTSSRCWTLTDPDDYLALWDANGHWPTPEDAEKYRARLAAESDHDMSVHTVTQEPAPCHTVTCRCGYVYDTSDDGVEHFASAALAAETVTAAGWARSGDGWSCRGCVAGKPRTITLAEFHEEARARFGEDRNRWAYQCPACGDIATAVDVAYALSQRPVRGVRRPVVVEQVLGQNCIACPADAKDYGTTIVRTPDGREARVFELAPKP